jgi:hypothetical protein
MATSARKRRVRWYTIPVRVVLITFILTLLSFAICLLVSILWTVVSASFRGATPDLRIAYRQIALPLAIGIGSAVLITSTINEIRYYRRTKTLTGIARATHNRAA